MRKRAYRQRRRAESAQQTRQRIIEAARACLTAAPLLSVSLEEIASRAVVARSTIYGAFGSRLGLLEAVGQDLLERGGFADIQAAFTRPEARITLEETLAASMRLYLAERAILRALTLQALIDPDAAALTQQMNEGRIGGMKHLATLLAQQGCLRPSVTVEEAGDILSLATDYILIDQLLTALELPPDAVLRRLQILARSILRDA